MKTEKIIENDLDEVTFEKRNKDYGAYYLRKKYDKNLTGALTIAITLMLLVVAIPLIANYINTDRFFGENTTVVTDMINIAKPNVDVPPPPPPPPPPIIPVTEKFKLIVPVIIDDTVDQGQLFTQAELSEMNSNEKIDEKEIEIDIDQTEKKVIDDNFNDEVFNFSAVSEKPFYNDGEVGLNKFITDNVKYPELAREYKIQGTVFITFIVEGDGSITNIKVLNGIGGGCDEEAERVVKMMPKWVAGKQNNKSVRVQVMIPVKFIVM